MSNAVSLAPDRTEFRSRNGASYILRYCQSIDDLDQCLALQQEAWGYPDLEVVPRNMYVLAQALGGHVIGAFTTEGRLAGYAMAVAAHEPASLLDGRWMRSVTESFLVNTQQDAAPKPYHHSHMLAVSPAHRDAGLGYALKFAQRRDSLLRGITHMRWTFDPLAVKNAYFNLQRLGATAKRYIPNFYGVTGSALQGGLPTDRLLAEWALTGKRALAAERREALPDIPVSREISIPSDLARWRAKGEMEPLFALQTDIQDQFSTAFTDGLILHSFVPDGQGGGRYLLSDPERP